MQTCTQHALKSLQSDSLNIGLQGRSNTILPGFVPVDHLALDAIVELLQGQCFALSSRFQCLGTKPSVTLSKWSYFSTLPKGVARTCSWS